MPAEQSTLATAMDRARSESARHDPAPRPAAMVGDVSRTSPSATLRDEMSNRRRSLQQQADSLERKMDNLREQMTKLQDDYRLSQAQRADVQQALDMVDLALRSNA